MKIIETNIKNLILIQHFTSVDERGIFMKPVISNELELNKLSEIYCTKSKKGVIRGLHYQTGEFAQRKYVTCLEGVIEDIALDLRISSSSYGKIYRKKLQSTDRLSILIPRGFAHAIFTHEESIVMTCCDNKYYPEHENGINWESLPDLCDLPVSTISNKDKALPNWNQL